MLFPKRLLHFLCASSCVVGISVVNFSIVHPTATFAWTPTTPQVSVATFTGDVESVAVDTSGNVYTTGAFSATVDFDPGPGTLIEMSQIPNTVDVGSHRVVLTGKNYSRGSVLFAAGIVLGTEESTSWLIRSLIGIPILLAIFVGLLLPALLRRKKTDLV